jgi:hypothetical protein
MVHCFTEREAKGWEKLVNEIHNGDEVAADAAWRANGFKVPAEAMALVNEDVKDNKFILEDDITTDAELLHKKEIIKDTKALLKAKLTNLNRLVQKYPGLEKGRDRIKEILDNIDEVSADETLTDFIIAAEHMTNSAMKWLKDFQDGTKTPTLDHIKRLEEYTASFSILQELSEDLFESQEHKDILKKLTGEDGILRQQQEIRQGYLKMARKLIAESLKGDFHKVTRLYEKKAEQIFNTRYAKNYDKKERAQAKAEFIAEYLTAHANEIDLRTEQYVQSMLLQTTDISALTAWVVNPKDMDHDIVNLALERLDDADLHIWNETSKVVDEAEELNKKFVKFVGKKGNPKKQYEMLFDRDLDGNIMPTMINPLSKGFTEFQAKYQGTPVWDLWTFLNGVVAKKNGMVFRSGKLNFDLPIVEQTTLERIYDQGPIATIKKGLGDQIKLRGKDVELGNISDEMLAHEEFNKANSVEQVTVTEGGEERAVIPLFYRNKSIPMDDRSYDIVKLMAVDYHNSLRFKTKTETSAFLEVLKDVVHESRVVQTTSFVKKLKINKDTGDKYTKQGASRVEETLDMLIRHRLYGMKYEGDPKTLKIYQTLGKYTSLITMGANILSGTANLVHGTTMSWIEAVGSKGGHFTPKDRLRAVKLYNTHVGGLLNDMGERVPKDKINLLSRMFNTFAESHIFNGKSFAQNSKIKRLAETSSIMGANNIGEHAMQSIVMLSILNNIKVKDVNGNYLDKDFNPTKDRSKAIGIYDAMLQDGTNLEFHPSVDSTEKTNGVGEKDIAKISKIIRRVNRDLYGNYDAENKARIQRTGAGALVGQMRGWLVPGMQKRWRGIGTTGILTKDFTRIGEEYTFENLHKLAYNYEIDDFEEGQYVTTMRWLRSSYKEMRALGVLAGNKELWNKLTDDQKGNIRKTVLEFGLIVATLMLANMFEDDPDDPNDIENVYLAYMSRRLFSELFTFANPKETLRTFRSPAIAMSTVENAIDVLIQLYDYDSYYETGRHVGESKLWRKIQKLIPVMKQVDRDVEDAYLFLTR